MNDFSNFPKYLKFQHKTILGIDYGTVYTGIATFCVGKDPYPTPFSKINYLNDEQLLKEILKIIDNESIDIVVLGLPLYLDGNSSLMTERVKKFHDLMLSEIKIPIYLQDETLTSFEAENRMKNSPQYNFKVNLEKIDSLSAAIILEDFIKS